MICSLNNISRTLMAGKTTILLCMSVVFFFAPSVQNVCAQRTFSRTYPATKNVRLQLLNRSGTVIVEAWDRPEINVSAYLEPPAANIAPQSLSGTIFIDLVKDNQGRAGVGNVNFRIRVPRLANVDIETRIGNLSVTNVSGGLVRAIITTEGDITLTNISSGAVDAQNGIGDIFFDGELRSGGQYRFTSVKGSINLRIPFESSFRLMATAPSTRNISLGSFASPEMTFGDGRRVYGRFGGGSSSLTVTNQRGSIALIRR
jgi:Putative adhesin